MEFELDFWMSDFASSTEFEWDLWQFSFLEYKMIRKNWKIIRAAAIVALPYLGSMITSVVTQDNDWPSSNWYKQLKKPRFTPPNWAIPIIWTLLYGSMGYASYLVYQARFARGVDVSLPLAVYGAQLAVNWAWSPLFINCKKYGAATISVFAMLGGAAASAGLFYRVNRTAAYLMLPYVAWLSLASAIMYSIWRNNPPAEPKFRRTFFGEPVGVSRNLKRRW